MEARRFIKCTPETLESIQSSTGVVQSMMSMSLNYKRNSPMAKRIRERALEMGGQVMVELPECETIHDHNGIMEQRFPNGALLYVDKELGEVMVVYRDKMQVKRQLGKIDDLMNMQRYAASLR